MKSFTKDLSYKLSTQAISFTVSIVTMGIVARTLGPFSYGIYNFITDFFQKFQKLILAGSMTGYYVKLSKNNDNAFAGSYHLYLFFLIPISLFLVLLAFYLNISGFIWPDKNLKYILYGCTIVLLSVQNKGLSSTYDGANETRYFERLLSLSYLINGVSIFALFYFNYLNLDSYFIFNIMLQLSLGLLGIVLALKKKIIILATDSSKKIYSHLKEIFTFSRPLVFYAIFIFFVGIADRWLIEFFYGSYEQGIFSIAFKLSSLILLLAAPFEKLLLRESSSIAKDKTSLKVFVETCLPLILFVGIAIASFLSINGDKILILIGGEAYSDAFICLYMLSFAFGLNFATHFMANINLAQEKTLTHVFIGVPIYIISLALSCYLLIPNDFSPELKSYDSVALKTLIVVIFHFFLVTFIVVKRLKLEISYLMIRIIFIPTLIIALSFLARFISNYFSILFIQLLISGMLFLILMVSFLFLILWNDHKHRDLKLKIINFLNINLNLNIK